MKKIDLKSNYIYILMLIVAAAISVSGIIFHQAFFRMCPLFVSLFVMALNSKANRYGLLIGSLNSLCYAAVYYYYNLIGTMFSALLISFPIQLVSFILWARKPYAKSTVFKSMKKWHYIVLATIMLASYIVTVWVIKLLHGSFAYLDAACFVFGIVVSILTLFAFVEYPVFNIISCILSIVLYVAMLPNNPEQTTYLIFSIYSFICVLRMRKSVKDLYLKQINEKAIT